MHIVADSDLFRRLTFDNPWWELKADTKIQFKNPPKRTFYNNFYKTYTDMPLGQILALAGPLRAGKTILLRQCVAGLIESGVHPSSVFTAT